MQSNTYINNLYSSINEFIKINLILISSKDKSILRFTNNNFPKFIIDLESDILNHFINTFSSNPTNNILFYKTDINLKYMGFALYNKNNLDGCIVIGPYLTSSISDLDIYDVTCRNNLSSPIAGLVYDFYKNIPLINATKENFLSNSIFYMINNNPHDISKVNINTLDTDSSYILDYSLQDCELTVENIRNRYDLESKMLHLISLGDEVSALSILSKDTFIDIERFPNAPLRNSKNLYITLNTLFRKAVQVNNIDAYLIHLTSEKYAIKIENSKSLKELESLMVPMIKSYCKLVNDYANNNYTSVVAGAINYIKLNFKNEINLESISSSLYVHPNYLSSRFKEETSLSITEFINDLRIKEAMVLLKTTSTLVSDIAYMVGFNDSKYFAKTFKKICGVTPTKYRNS